MSISFFAKNNESYYVFSTLYVNLLVLNTKLYFEVGNSYSKR